MVRLSAEHYPLIEKAVAYLEQHYKNQPNLDLLAQHIGLSPSHFQRLFREGVGISPKRFLQYTTLKHARTLLAANQNLLNTSLELGLSGPSRLYDLFVECEAITPGAYKTRGEGLTLNYGVGQTPLGQALLVVSNKGIVELAFLPDRRHRGQSIPEYLAQKWPAANLNEEPKQISAWLERIFTPQSAGRIPIHLQGTNFQIQVWQALLKIPAGQLISYQVICDYLHQPGAARAVGSAVGKNPISYLIPCHRVLRTDGGVGGYAGGTPRKRILLAWEGLQTGVDFQNEIHYN